MNATSSQSPVNSRASIWPWAILAGLAVLASVYLTVFGGRSRESYGTRGPAIGRKLLYLKLEPLTGESKSVSLEDLNGRVTVMNYWGTWCPPCRREFPHIVDLAEKFSGQEDFRLYAVSCGQGADEDLNELRDETQKFLESNKASIPTCADQNAASRQAMLTSLSLEGFGYPTTVVFDRQGTIRGFWVGYEPGSEHEMQALVESLLSESVHQPSAT